MTARRDWFAIYVRVVRTPKFRRLSDAAQLSLFYVWCLAGDETPEATWSTPDGLGDLLELHGRPRDTVDELTRTGWLDLLKDGRLAVHDWDEHQLAATADARRKWEAAYMREWRRRGKEPPSPIPLPPTRQHITGQHRSGQHVDNTPSADTRSEPLKRECPRCGEDLDDKDTNVAVVSRNGQLAHYPTCPGMRLSPEPLSVSGSPDRGGRHHFVKSDEAGGPPTTALALFTGLGGSKWRRNWGKLG